MHRFPSIERFVFEHGWIEVGRDDFSTSFIRASDIGGMIWEGKDDYDSLDAAFADLELALTSWLAANFGRNP